MIRLVLASLVLLWLTAPAHSDTPPNPTDVVHATLFNQAHPDSRLLRSRPIPSSAHLTPAALSCCKVCSVGKACGNTCISRDKTCHVGPGCACDG
jgi:hypothetical protein